MRLNVSPMELLCQDCRIERMILIALSAGVSGRSEGANEESVEAGVSAPRALRVPCRRPLAGAASGFISGAQPLVASLAEYAEYAESAEG